MEPVSFPARDGLHFHGYLTLPVDGIRTCLPTVVKLHGGPWERDVWGYDAEVQWLASRGYACLQVNFRGSSGYGKAFLNAGNYEWGGRIQEDIADVAAWAVTSGIADADRVAVMGTSFGGYGADGLDPESPAFLRRRRYLRSHQPPVDIWCCPRKGTASPIPDAGLRYMLRWSGF